ncbi:FecR family protein [Chitinophaga sp. CF118]|uniref:FecR family protein n=1 Tax=Chitinophaga sp. CF118 TaxID=1884367 RepID=UPI0008ECB641|nr:FecR domain-containing protein [Chitinophaga sp. CF118]SFD47814.1 FecR family protein [Chitinophaga sp. CF118]
MKREEALLDKFYNGTCTPDEAKMVMDLLLAQETDSEEWGNTPFTGNGYEAEMLIAIHANTFGSKTRVRNMTWVKIAVAASVLLICSLFIVRRNERKVTPIASLKNKHAINGISYNAPANKKMRIKLTDGSIITLEPGAFLQYDSTVYNNNNRTLYLEGKASFTVTANREKPFIVNAAGFSTIALGTSFMVSAQQSHDLQVRLFSGKVVVRKTDNAFKEVCLRPGEELVYSYVTHKEKVSRFEGIHNNILPVPVQQKGISIYDDNMVFNNAPLKDVLELFRHKYHITIQYDEQSISSVYFSGKVLASDPVELILKTITRINNLTLISREGVFIIQ